MEEQTVVMDYTNQSQLGSFSVLSKKERKALKKQHQQEARKREARNRVFTYIGVVAFIIAVVGLVIWVGINKTKQQTDIETSSSVGKFSPDFSLPSTTGEKITLSDFKDKKNILIYFHEGLSCDPCIQQIPELEKSMDEFDKLNIQVLAISGVDSIDELKQSLDRFGIKKIPLLSYTNARTEKDYNLLPHSMAMGRRAGHTFVLVGTDGKILWRKDYWPDYGMMTSRGTMFVNSPEIVGEVKKALNK